MNQSLLLLRSLSSAQKCCLLSNLCVQGLCQSLPGCPYRWGGEPVGRERAMPHIKSYARCGLCPPSRLGIFISQPLLGTKVTYGSWRVPHVGPRELLDICMTVSGMPNWATSDVLSMPSAADYSAVNGRHAAFCGQLQSQVLYRVTLQLVQVHKGWAGSLGAVDISQPQQGCLGRAAALRRQTSAAGQEL